MTRRSTLALLAGTLLAGLTASAPALAQSGPAVFVGTNHNNTLDFGQAANQVVMYKRGANGALQLFGYFNTGGQGSGPSIRFAGDGLGSSHSIQLSQDGRFLFVVNAGSDNLSVFRVLPRGLQLVDLVATGAFPNSVTQRGNLVYVLNSIGQGSINGYRFNGNNGRLTPIIGSTRTLNANQDNVRPDTLFNPTQVSFTPDGTKLVVTIKDGPLAGLIPNAIPTGPGRVLVFGVGPDGRPSQGFVQTNLQNRGPFGFSFDRRGNMFLALFVGGPNLTSSVGSFRITPSGQLSPITSNLLNTQLDSCWFENNGRYGWTANYTSGTISGYRIGNDGSLTLLSAVAGTTDPAPVRQGSTPLDLAVSGDGRFLYNVLPGSGKVAGFRINDNGSLTKIGEFGGLPRTVNGDSAPFEYGPGGSPAGIVAN